MLAYRDLALNIAGAKYVLGGSDAGGPDDSLVAHGTQKLYETRVEGGGSAMS